MVKRALDYVCVETPLEIQELIEGQLLEKNARKEVGTESFQPFRRLLKLQR
jgi:hypothetical protein